MLIVAEVFALLKWYLEERMRTYLSRIHNKKSRVYGYAHYPSGFLYEKLGLFKVPLTAPLTQTAKATGRR